MASRYVIHPITREPRKVADAYFNHSNQEYHVQLENRYHPKGHHTNEFLTLQTDGSVSAYISPSRNKIPVSTRILGALFSSI